MRTIVDLTDEQLQSLADRCAHEHISRAEAIRRAVEFWLSATEEDAAQRAFDAAFGSWKSHPETTDEYLESIRSEWNR